MPSEIRSYKRPELRQAWRGPALLVVDNAGRAGGDPLSGFYFRETRHLSALRLFVQGEEPVPCSAAEVAANALEFSLIYPPVRSAGGGGSGSGGDARHRGILTRGLDLDLRVTVHPASLELALAVGCRWDEEVALRLEWELAADYAGLLEAMAEQRQQEAEVAAEALPGGVRFRYLHPRLPLSTRIVVEGGDGWSFAGGRLAGGLVVRRQEIARVTLEVRAEDAERPLSAVDEAAREAHLEAYLARQARFHAAAETPLVMLTRHALRDLGSASLLEGEPEEWSMPAAGYPLYPAAFGRDAATASWQAAAFDHGELARSTCARLARLQGTRRDDARDEEVGRIIQQARQDPLSRLGELPFDRYYGDVASPFMYVIALGNAYGWNGDRAMVERHWGPVRRVLDWAREHGDLDGDGYVEYRTRSPHGPRHQAWKDSDNAVVDEEGRQVDGPFASCETQGYHMATLQIAAGLALVVGERGEALALWRRAAELKERFNRDFWLPEEGFVAFGLDADKRPLRVLTSNAAQCIATGIVADEHLPRLVRRIFEPDLFTGWGLRTISSENPAYNPLSYHLGSVWPVENGSVVFGLRRYGFDERALQLARSLYDLALAWPGDRVPECVGGYDRRERGHPGAYPRANPFQSWNRSVFPIVVQSILGARAVAALKLLALDPVLPYWLPQLTVKRWRVGESTISLRFWRDGDGKSHHEVLEREGELRVVRQPPIDSLTAGVRDRLRHLVRDVLPF